MNEEFEVTKSEYNATVEVEDIWDDPVVKLLISHISFVASSVDKGVAKAIEIHQKKKLEELFEIILKDGAIGIENVKDVECIMEIAKTIDVVNRLIRNDKVKYLGRLLKNSILDSERNIDEFEELLNKLSELSLREINMLHLLYNEEIEFSSVNDQNNKTINLKKSWNSFIEKAKLKFMLNESEIISIMLGIMRTGFCIAEWGTISDTTALVIYTSPEYQKMLKKIECQKSPQIE